MKYLNIFEDSEIWRNRRKKTVTKYKRAMKKMSLEETADFIVENCQEYLKTPAKIMRGIDDNYDYFYSVPVKRYSRDNSNHYSMIMDNAVQWKDYPKRTKSFICSTNEVILGVYEYYVIPLDGAKFGIAQTYDIFWAFREGLKEFGSFVYAIDDFFEKLCSVPHVLCQDIFFNS